MGVDEIHESSNQLSAISGQEKNSIEQCYTSVSPHLVPSSLSAAHAADFLR
jgi:hypothetical protein